MSLNIQHYLSSSLSFPLLSDLHSFFPTELSLCSILFLCEFRRFVDTHIQGMSCKRAQGNKHLAMCLASRLPAPWTAKASPPHSLQCWLWQLSSSTNLVEISWFGKPAWRASPVMPQGWAGEASHLLWDARGRQVPSLIQGCCNQKRYQMWGY